MNNVIQGSGLGKRDLRDVDIEEGTRTAIESIRVARHSLDKLYSTMIEARLTGDVPSSVDQYVDGCQAAHRAIEELEFIQHLMEAKEVAVDLAEDVPPARESGTCLRATEAGDHSRSEERSLASQCESLAGKALKLTRKAAISLIDAQAAARIEGSAPTVKKIDEVTVCLAFLRDNLHTAREYARGAAAERNELLARIAELEAERVSGVLKAGAR